MRLGRGSIFLCFKGCIFSLKHELESENPWRGNKHNPVLICHMERTAGAADAGNFGVVSGCSVCTPDHPWCSPHQGPVHRWLG